MSYILQVAQSSDGAATGAYLAGCEDNRVDFVFELDRARHFTTQGEAQQFVMEHPPLGGYRFRMWSDR